MSFLTGQTKELLPGDVQGFRKQLLDFIGNQGLGTVLRGAEQPIDLAPFQELFRQRREVGLAQAKESAGTLTGSGFANILGQTAGRSIAEENAFLGQLMENARQQSANRFLQLIGGVPGFVGQQGYQPGFLDYLFQGAQAAAPLIAASAERLKEDVSEVRPGDAAKLKPVRFRYKDSRDRTWRYGIIADEAAKKAPEVVLYDESGRPTAVDYGRLSVILLSRLRQLEDK